MKDILIFDTTQIDHSDQVGSYLFGSTGNLIDSVEINSVERLAVDATLKDGAGTALTSTLSTGKQALDVNIAASDIQIQVELVHTEDSVRLGDGAAFFTSTTVDSNLGLDVNIINYISNTALKVTTATASDADPVLLTPTALANRQYLYIYNHGNQRIYIGEDEATLESTTGFPISPGSYMELRVGSAIDVFFMQNGGVRDVRLMELS